MLIRASAGLNVGLDYLPGSVTYDPVAWQPDADLASRIVCFDAFVTNVDRTAKNVNLLVWHRQLHLIDHGAALYFHHDWQRAGERAKEPFARIRDHVLLPRASRLREAEAELVAKLSRDVIERIVAQVPDEWLAEGDGIRPRAAYVDYLCARLEPPRAFIEEALRARAALV